MRKQNSLKYNVETEKKEKICEFNELQLSLQVVRSISITKVLLNEKIHTSKT